MMTLRMFSRGVAAVPMATAWHLADLGEARGRQQIYLAQAPQRLRTLAERALIESALSSCRMDGVEVDRLQVGTAAYGDPPVHSGYDEEVQAYQTALSRIHRDASNLPIAEDTILTLHRTLRGETEDAGQYRTKTGDTGEDCPDGRGRVRFKAVPVRCIADYMQQLMELWQSCERELWVHPLIAVAAFNLDFRCIRPFSNGNGRVSRLLLQLQLNQLGFEAGRHVALDRLIEENRQRYGETLEQSSRGWHEKRHDPWPYMNCLLHIVKLACREFEERLK